MRLELTGRHVDITPGLRGLVEDKLAKLERLLNDRAVSAQAVLTREKRRYRADITLHARGEKFLHGVGAAGSWEASLTSAIDKIGQQAQKIKGKWQDRKRQPVKTAAVAAEAPQATVVRPAAGGRGARERPRMPRVLHTTRRPIKVMSVTDAARELDADGGVVVFRDVQTTGISVLFRRDGELTLVETEAAER
jgi:ribosome hibernation promoting factor